MGQGSMGDTANMQQIGLNKLRGNQKAPKCGYDIVEFYFKNLPGKHVP